MCIKRDSSLHLSNTVVCDNSFKTYISLYNSCVKSHMEKDQRMKIVRYHYGNKHEKATQRSNRIQVTINITERLYTKDEDCDVNDGDENDTDIDAVEKYKLDKTTKTWSTRLMTSKYQHYGERSNATEQRESPRQHDEQSNPTDVTVSSRVGDSSNGEVLNHGETEHRQSADYSKRCGDEECCHEVNEEQTRLSS